jgi:ABC-type cobalamin transport system permease subunit
MSVPLSRVRIRKVVDLRAVITAALVAGTVSVLCNFFLVPSLLHTTPWVSVRLVGSILLGNDVLAPPATFHAGALAAALVTHYLLALAMTAIIAYVVHRGGLTGGILLGALLGLAFYSIDYYTLTYFMPQFFALQHWSVVASHILFGAIAGGTYELFEDQIFETDFGRS